MSYGGGYNRYGSGSSYTPSSSRYGSGGYGSGGYGSGGYGSGSTGSLGYGSSRGLSGSTYTPSTDRFSRAGIGSRLGGDTSTTATVDRIGSRADRNSSAGSYSTRDKDKAASTPCANCKKIVEDKDTLISKLQKDVKEKDEEIADLKSQASKSGIGRSGTSDSDKRERRALERRISELEEEVKTVKQLKADNQRLKDENGALVRVISKLSK